MSLFGTCDHKNLTAEYVEEKLALEAALDDIDLDDENAVTESYIDALLEGLELED